MNRVVITGIFFIIWALNKLWLVSQCSIRKEGYILSWVYYAIVCIIFLTLNWMWSRKVINTHNVWTNQDQTKQKSPDGTK